MYPNLYERVQISVQTEESWLQQISMQQPSEYLGFLAFAGGRGNSGLKLDNQPVRKGSRADAESRWCKSTLNYWANLLISSSLSHLIS